MYYLRAPTGLIIRQYWTASTPGLVIFTPNIFRLLFHVLRILSLLKISDPPFLGPYYLNTLADMFFG